MSGMHIQEAVSLPRSEKAREREKKRVLREEKAAWQWAAAGLFVLAVLVNIAQTARITALEKSRVADREAYQEQLEQAEDIRDLAVRRLGELYLQVQQVEQARELAARQLDELTAQLQAGAEARAAQAAAYEAVGIYRYVGECTITAYCPCEKCCGRGANGLTATGLPAEPGIVAVDPEVIPLGSTVVIDGQKYLAADTGVTGNHVDIFMTDHADTVRHGVRTERVWVVEP